MRCKRVIATAVALLLTASAGMLPAYADYAPSVTVDERVSAADEPSAAVMTVDAFLVRPLAFVATVLGAGIFVVSLPFSAIGGNVDEAAEALVAEPAQMTFTRPLGHFND